MKISEQHFLGTHFKNIRDSLFEKLELKSRVGLAVYALKKGYSE